MAASTLSRRRATRHAEQRAAKERKQKIFLVFGVVLLALLLVWELPKVLKSTGGSDTTSAPTVTPSTTTPVVPTASPAVVRQDLRAIRRLSPHDVFGRAGATGAEPTYQDVPVPAGVRDPFKDGSSGSSSSSSSSAPAATPTAPSSGALPAQIVVGTPAGGKVAKSGWIVILASIPTSEGRSAAQRFVAHAAKQGMTGLSILNSSNSRPLRGGYWVVYSGPFQTIAQVDERATSVHQDGYASAYVRQLVVYRAR